MVVSPLVHNLCDLPINLWSRSIFVGLNRSLVEFWLESSGALGAVILRLDAGHAIGDAIRRLLGILIAP